MLKLFMQSRNQKGFTLVELIVVLVILGILAAILVPTMIGWIDKSKDAQYQLEARSVYMACQGLVSEAYGKGKLSLGSDGAAEEYLNKTDTLKQVKELSGVNIDDTASDVFEVTTIAEGVNRTIYSKINTMKFDFKSNNGNIDVNAELTSSGDWKFAIP